MTTGFDTDSFRVRVASRGADQAGTRRINQAFQVISTVSGSNLLRPLPTG